ncbi:hypothetical protein [Rhizobium bangladeshense]|uniref:Uncharacterized protein n=1 Tax=Rhizobium bangladeshense TaxID=1138189 RepID=A0ABS7LI05_9HYPH|nr:hypothetical protein [Rhizobium bangladeshense]MBX4870710.1 hypothetical protein [Rhizobium bangladeshense]MBX4872575.1 hypothetical protein [Rhizobium bangladeshense]MBX4883892.1 hypothetical protein [Rhizobium bangladeshense]MBX4895525.1 hypothetical protein [Rhizobium bangladeshense]MBX4901552.1 hypothetical protein [Rhizobium bangladeshense]
MVDATQLLSTVFVPGRWNGCLEMTGFLSIPWQHLQEQQIAGAVAASVASEASAQAGKRQVLAAAPGNIPPVDKHLAATCAATGINDKPLR